MEALFDERGDDELVEEGFESVVATLGAYSVCVDAEGGAGGFFDQD